MATTGDNTFSTLVDDGEDSSEGTLSPQTELALGRGESGAGADKKGGAAASGSSAKESDGKHVVLGPSWRRGGGFAAPTPAASAEVSRAGAEGGKSGRFSALATKTSK
jgi:hypothetical protein